MPRRKKPRVNLQPAECKPEEIVEAEATPVDMSMVPDDVLLEILKRIPAAAGDGESESSESSLLNCRLVCKKWKTLIDNSTPMMRRLTFKVENLRTFTESSIRTKAKSIRFEDHVNWSYFDFNQTADKQTQICSSKMVKHFFGQLGIGPTIEKICFNFSSHTKKSAKFHRMLVWEALKSCSLLSEIIFPEFSDLKVFRGLRDKEKVLLGASNIRRVSLDIGDIESGDLDGLKTLISCLPKLSSLSCCEGSGFSDNPQVIGDWLIFLLSIMELNKLKNMKLDMNHNQPSRIKQILVKVVMKAHKHAINLDSASMNMIDLTSLFKVRNEPDFPPETPDLYASITQAILPLNDAPPLDSNIIARCCGSNLLELRIDANRNIQTEELNFLPKLSKLRQLKMKLWPRQLNVPLEVFRFEIPTLETLIIGTDFRPEPWGDLQVFCPNLVYLKLQCMNGLQGKDFILLLARLETLVTLELTTLFDLSDAPFITQCPTSLVPAIATFKNLKHLVIEDCRSRELTNRCLVEGISYCQKLETLELNKQRHFTKNGINAIMQRTNLKLITQVVHTNYSPRCKTFTFSRTLIFKGMLNI